MIGKNMFIEAVSAIDAGFIEEAVIAENNFYNKSKSTKKSGKSIVIKFAAIAASVALVLAVGGVIKSGLKFNNFINPTPILPVFDEEEKIVEIFSDNDDDVGVSKPMPSHRVWGKSKSYYKKDEKVIVTAGMAEGNLSSYLNSETITGYPLFKVVVVDEVRGNEIKNSGVIINGCEDEFSIKFDEADMPKIDINLYNAEPEEYHQEQLEIDFSNLKPGECGKVKIHFGWFYESGKEGPYSDGTGYGYHAVFLSYFVGEEGVGLSFVSVNRAKENLGKVEDISHILRKEDFKYC